MGTPPATRIHQQEPQQTKRAKLGGGEHNSGVCCEATTISLGTDLWDVGSCDTGVTDGRRKGELGDNLSPTIPGERGGSLPRELSGATRLMLPMSNVEVLGRAAYSKCSQT